MRITRSERGFTLIEIMVALAVFSLAALALIRLEGATIRGATTLDSTLTAQLVARNVAIEAVTDARPPVIGDTTGVETNGGRAWSCSARTTGPATAPVSAHAASQPAWRSSPTTEPSAQPRKAMVAYPCSAQWRTAACVPAAPSTSTQRVNVGSSHTRPKVA